MGLFDSFFVSKKNTFEVSLEFISLSHWAKLIKEDALKISLLNACIGISLTYKSELLTRALEEL